MKTASQVERDWLNCSRKHRSTGFYWYANAKKECELLGVEYSLPLPIVAGVVSAVSPLCPWGENMERAERIIRWHSEGRKGDRPSVTFGKNCDKADRILALREPDKEFKTNTKTRSFWLNLCGDLRPVTIDTWMLVFHGDPRKGLCRNRAYWSACSPIVDAASRIGIFPAQLQAVLWLDIRERTQKGGGTLNITIPD